MLPYAKLLAVSHQKLLKALRHLDYSYRKINSSRIHFIK